MKTRCFGIKTPTKNNEKSYIWWFSESAGGAWSLFFTYPNKYGERNSYRLPLEEAIRAYQAIGYECVEVEMLEIGKVTYETVD